MPASADPEADLKPQGPLRNGATSRREVAGSHPAEHKDGGVCSLHSLHYLAPHCA